MNHYVFRPVTVAVCLALLAAACNPITPASITASAVNQTVATTSPTALTWMLFTNPEDAYSIEYPSGLGQITIDYEPVTRTSILTWDRLNGYDVEISFINPNSKSLHTWLASSGQLTENSSTLLVNGLTGIVVAPGLVYFENDRDGYPSPVFYEINFECYAESQPCSPPPFWRAMINSFQALPSDAM